MDGCQKVATLLLALAPEVAGELLAKFDDAQRAEIVEAMLSTGYVEPAGVEQVLAEFEQACGAEHRAIVEPAPRVRSMLETALGEGQADAYIRGHSPVDEGDPFAALDRLETRQLVSLLGDEHPQTVAIVLSRLSAAAAGQVLSELPEEVASEVVHRIVSCEQAALPAVVERIGRVLAERVAALSSSRDPWATPESRLQLVADVLAAAKESSRDAALEAVKARDPQAGERVRSLMFLFEDLASLGTGDVRKVVSAVESQVVALALKTASDAVKEAIFGALSKRAGESLREELELLGPRPLSEVEGAQRAIVEAVLRLDEEGEIRVPRGAEEQLV